MTGFAAALDQVKGLFIGDADEGAEVSRRRRAVGRGGAGQSGPVAMHHLGRGGGIGPVFGGAGRAVSGGELWLGQVANPCAHELIHRTDRLLYRLGVLVYAALLFGHHASAHRLVHHVHAATPDDPNSARSGEGFYAFAFRAWTGSFRQGYLAGRGGGVPGGCTLMSAISRLPGPAFSPGSGLRDCRGCWFGRGWPPMRKCSFCCRIMCNIMGLSANLCPMAAPNR